MVVTYLIHRDKFTDSFIQFFRDCFSSELVQNFVTIEDSQKYSVGTYDNLTLISSWSEIQSPKIRKLLEDSDKIVISGIFDINEYINSLHKDVIKKSYLHFWGGDFYNLELSEEKGLSGIKQMMSKKLRKHRISKFLARGGSVINLIKQDSENFVKLYPRCADRHFVAPVPKAPADYKKLEQYEARAARQSDEIKILIGNSAAVTNNHLDALKLLEKFKEEDFKLIVPLSYGGTQSYIDEVIQYGKDTFGDKFVPILDYMSLDEYQNMMTDIKIAMFPLHRQQAMGNINFLIRCGIKVYLYQGEPLERYYCSLGIKTYHLSDVKKLEFHELISKDEQVLQTNSENIKKEISYTGAEKKWREILMN